MWETIDPDGRRIILTVDRWLHILDDHEELAGELEAILEGVPSPTFRTGGRWSDEEWFYIGGLGPSRYVKVVVHYEDEAGRIITAFPRRAFP